MVRRHEYCKHENTRFHSIQRLGTQPPIELRQCLTCHSTIAVETREAALTTAGVAASY